MNEVLNSVVFLTLVLFCSKGFRNCLVLSTENEKLTLKSLFVQACHWPESFGHLDMTMSWYGKHHRGQLQLHNIPKATCCWEPRWFLAWDNNIRSKQSESAQAGRLLVTAIASRQCISSASLSRARLFNLPYAALRYYSGQYCPQNLLAGMAEYGVNFATFNPLNAEALDFLTAWRECQGKKCTKEKWWGAFLKQLGDK